MKQCSVHTVVSDTHWSGYWDEGFGGVHIYEGVTLFDHENQPCLFTSYRKSAWINVGLRLRVNQWKP